MLLLHFFHTIANQQRNKVRHNNFLGKGDKESLVLGHNFLFFESRRLEKWQVNEICQAMAIPLDSFSSQFLSWTSLREKDKREGWEE